MRVVKLISTLLGFIVVIFIFRGLFAISRLTDQANQSNFERQFEGKSGNQSKSSRLTEGATLKQRPKAPEECPKTGIQTSHEVNLEKIRNYTFPGAEPYLSKLFARSSLLPKGKERILPVFVTAVSSSHVKEAMLLFDNINHVVRKGYPDITIYVYDIGLTEEDKKKVKSKCSCTVRRFPFDEYPEHVSYLKGYAWKPIIVQLIAQEHPVIFWIDTSPRFKLSNLDFLFKKAENLAILATKGFNSISSRTHLDTFVALNEDPCVFSKPVQMQACFIVFYLTDFIRDYFLKPWVGCALSPGCMVPTGDPYDHLECVKRKRKDIFHMCHRFDQSVMNILLYRMYDKHFADHVMDFDFYKVDRLGSNLV